MCQKITIPRKSSKPLEKQAKSAFRACRKYLFYTVTWNPRKPLVKRVVRLLPTDSKKVMSWRILSKFAAGTWQPLVKLVFLFLWHIPPSYRRWRVFQFYTVTWKPCKPLVKLLFWRLPRNHKKNVLGEILFRLATEPWWTLRNPVFPFLYPARQWIRAWSPCASMATQRQRGDTKNGGYASSNRISRHLILI